LEKYFQDLLKEYGLRKKLVKNESLSSIYNDNNFKFNSYLWNLGYGAKFQGTCYEHAFST
jgi:hypothetical protein